MKREEYNEGLNTVYDFFRNCQQTMIDMCQKYGRINLEMDAQDYSFTLYEHEGTYTPVSVESDKGNIYVTLIDSNLISDGEYPEEDTFEIEFCDFNNDLTIISGLMEAVFDFYDSRHETITYNGIEYTLYEITPNDKVGTVTVAPESLWHSMAPECEPENDDAHRIDEQIYAYLPDDVLEGDEKSIIEYFNRYFD